MLKYNRYAYTVDGNTVRKQHLEHKHNTHNNKQQLHRQQIKIKSRKMLMYFLLIFFVGGTFTISRENTIYQVQKQSTNLDKEINELEESNEYLKTMTLKSSGINKLKDKAATQLKMDMPNMEDVVKIDFSEDYFVNIK